MSIFVDKKCHIEYEKYSVHGGFGFRARKSLGRYIVRPRLLCCFNMVHPKISSIA